MGAILIILAFLLAASAAFATLVFCYAFAKRDWLIAGLAALFLLGMGYGFERTMHAIERAYTETQRQKGQP